MRQTVLAEVVKRAALCRSDLFIGSKFRGRRGVIHLLEVRSNMSSPAQQLDRDVMIIHRPGFIGFDAPASFRKDELARQAFLLLEFGS